MITLNRLSHTSPMLFTSKMQYSTANKKIQDIFDVLKNDVKEREIRGFNKSPDYIPYWQNDEPSIKSLFFLVDCLWNQNVYSSPENYNKHYDNLPEYLEEIFKNGDKVPFELLMHLLKRTDRYDTLLPMLAKHAVDLQNTDKDGRTLLHLAVLKKMPELIHALREKGLEGDKRDNQDISSEELALWTMDRSVIRAVTSCQNVKDQFSKITKEFHGAIAEKLNNSTNPRYFEKALPDISTIEPVTLAEERFIFLYRPISLGNKKLTPMGEAIETRSLGKIEGLVSRGWSDIIENYLREYPTEGAYILEYLEETQENKEFFIEATAKILGAPGISRARQEAYLRIRRNWGQPKKPPMDLNWSSWNESWR